MSPSVTLTKFAEQSGSFAEATAAVAAADSDCKSEKLEVSAMNLVIPEKIISSGITNDVLRDAKPR